MICSVICAKGVGSLYFVDGSMNSQQYLQVIQQELLPQIQNWFRKTERFQFMQDGAPCHRAKMITNYLNTQKVSILDWPDNSPDMNPIENVWNVLKDEFGKEKVTTKAESIDKIKYLWFHNAKMNQTAINGVRSMEDRVRMLLKNNGKWIKY